MTSRRPDSGGRAARIRARQAAESAPGPLRNFVERKIPVFEPYSDAQMATIESNADYILEKIGVEFHDADWALDLYRQAGATIEGSRARFEPGFLTELIRERAPTTFTQHARNPARSVPIGGPHSVFAPAYGPPFVRCLEKGRRYAELEDFQNFVKLAYLSPGLHHSGGTVCEPTDVPVNKRHLDMLRAHMVLSDKPFMGSVTSSKRAEDTVALCRLLFGEAFVEGNCVVISLINANSPLTFDETMLGALRVYAEAGQGTVISPFILAGAMSPVAVVGTLSQIHAEVLAGAALAQLVRPGAPVIYGTFAATVSMQSGAPTFGTPESSLILYGASQLARRLGIPFRSGGGLCSSKIADAQAAYEACTTLQTSALAGVHFMLHTAGWLEGGLTVGYEKFVMDADQAVMAARLLGGADFSENGQALSAIEEVGPGSHFLGAAHTRQNFETAFYRSPLADVDSFEQWESQGSKDMTTRAHERWKSMLAAYTPPALESSTLEKLDAFIQERKNAEPDSWV